MKKSVQLIIALFFSFSLLAGINQNAKAQSCQADFTFADSCLSVDFFDLSFDSLGTVMMWSWDFGDGFGTSSIPNPSYTYSTGGSFVVQLQIRTTTACIDLFTDTVTVSSCGGPSICRSEFTSSDSCLTVDFTNTSASSPGTIVSTTWDFGDGGGSGDYDPSHTYLSSGTYNVCLEILTSDGCSDTFCDMISVACGGGGACIADFWTIDSCTQISFYDLSSATPGAIISWDWDFGDGSSSSLNEPIHDFIFPGTYNVSLTIETSDTCTNMVTYPITVNTCGGGGCSASWSEAVTCRDVNFSDLSVPSGGSVTAWSWDFGDGGSSNLQNPFHSYAFDNSYIVCLTIVDSLGCSDTYCDTVAIACGAPACESNWGWMTVADCEVQFSDSSLATPGIVNSWHWDFGDGDTSNIQNPGPHTYPGSSMYNVCLSIGTTDGCMDTLCEPISITCGGPVSCNANFSTSDSCRTVNFTDLSSASPGSVTGWSWTFGDGSTDTTANPVHTYASDSVYTVCLEITTSDSCTKSFCRFVTVSCAGPPTCAAGFSWADSCLSVNLMSTSTASPGTVTSHVWDFGDGSSSGSPNPSHTYTVEGSYLVTVDITTSDGCSSSFSDSVMVSKCTATCGASISVADTCPDYTFTSSPTGTGPFTIDWDFGDTESGMGDSIKHTYASNGSYEVIVYVEDSTGCQASDTSVIFVSCLAPPACSVDIAFADSCPDIHFTATGIGTGSLSYSWDFDDGGFGSGVSPSHTYSANGSYDVIVTMTDSTGCLVRDTQNVVIACVAPPTCSVSFITTDSCPMYDFDATGLGTGTLNYSWDFDDGAGDVFEDVFHTYGANGTYGVCVTMTDSLGCSDTFCDTFMVTCIPPPCSIGFTYSDSCPNFHFDITTTGAGDSVLTTTFGDGSSSSLDDPIHTYTMNGSYEVCATVIDSAGCTASICDSVIVICLPDVCNADFSKADSCPTIFFTNLSTISSTGPASYTWTFGDGGSSGLENPSHTYSANGTYPVTLIVEDLFSGCMDTLVDSVTVSCLTPGSCVGFFTIVDSGNPTFSFMDSSMADSGETITSWIWNFGDGSSATGDSASHTYTASGVYPVCLTITTSSGCTDVFCDSVNVIIVGRFDSFEETSIQLYPNPANGFVRIAVDSGFFSDINVDAMDMTGRILMRWTGLQDGSELDLSSIANGVYLFRIDSGGEIQYEKIIVRK